MNTAFLVGMVFLVGYAEGPCSHYQDEGKAFSPQRTEQPLAEGVGLGTLWRRFQYPESQVLYTLIEVS